MLRTVRCDQSAMDEQINAAVTFLRKVSTEDPIQEFRRKHRRRQVPIRFDPNRTTPEIQMTQFYRMEFNKFLDLVITEYGDNLNSCLEKIKPLVIVLKLPVSIPAIDDIKALVEFFPRTIEIDPYVLHAEFSIFVAHVDALILQYPDRSFNTLAEIANYSEERKSVFPLTNKCYHLLMTIPVSVAKDERTFSRLKLVKTPSRSKMSDDRLESLLLISCEKDITDSLDLVDLAKDWANLKNRRIKLPQ